MFPAPVEPSDCDIDAYYMQVRNQVDSRAYLTRGSKDKVWYRDTWRLSQLSSYMILYSGNEPEVRNPVELVWLGRREPACALTKIESGKHNRLPKAQTLVIRSCFWVNMRNRHRLYVFAKYLRIRGRRLHTLDNANEFNMMRYALDWSPAREV